MTVTAPETTRTVNPLDPPLNHAARRESLVNAARIRYRHPGVALVHVALDAPAVPAAEHAGWLDEFGALVDRWYQLRDVRDPYTAREVLNLMQEGPWEDDPAGEAQARAEELSAEIDQMVWEAQ